MAIIYAESAEIEATSDHATLTFQSGDETIRILLPHSVAIAFESKVARGSWPLHCAPDGEVVSMNKIRRQRRDWRKAGDERRIARVMESLEEGRLLRGEDQ